MIFLLYFFIASRTCSLSTALFEPFSLRSLSLSSTKKYVNDEKSLFHFSCLFIHPQMDNFFTQKKEKRSFLSLIFSPFRHRIFSLSLTQKSLQLFLV